MPRPSQQSVSRRRVFYIPGYDPIHPRRYRELYRAEGAVQAGLSGYGLQLKPRMGTVNYGWHVHTQVDGKRTHTEFDVMVWSDIVRDSMSGTIGATYAQMIYTGWVYITSGAFWRLMKLRKGPVMAALYPLGMLILQLVFAIALSILVQSLLTQFVTGVAGHLSAAVVGACAGYGLLRLFKSYDSKLFVYYLMHDYAYSASSRGANPPELEERISQFRDMLYDELMAGEVDEVLVVGHSSGAHLGVSILADVLRKGDIPDTAPALSFLTLGHVVPMVSFLPKADRLRADLRFLSERADITWVDVSAPGDGCCFALCDPVAVSGVASEAKKWPVVFSAAFTQTLSEERWQELRWRFFRLHFQYMCAFDRPADYDYFQITGGPITLAERYGDRASSSSRIERSVNKYTSIAA